jgi:hypothetical protein
MRRYEQVSGVFFSILAIVQLTRVIAGWEVNVANIVIPAWASVAAFLVAGSFAVWAFRATRRAT